MFVQYSVRLAKRCVAVILVALLLCFLPLEEGAAARQPPAPGVRVVIVGDGFIGGKMLMDERDSFANQLSRTSAIRIAGNVEILDLTRDEETSNSLVSYVPHVMEYRPDIWIIGIGLNDALMQIDPDIVQNNINTLLHDLTRHGQYVMLLEYRAPKNLSHNYALQFNPIYAEVVSRYSSVNYIKGIMYKILENEHLQEIDGLHPNRAGIKEIVDAVAMPLNEMIRRMKIARNCEKARAEQNLNGIAIYCKSY